MRLRPRTVSTTCRCPPQLSQRVTSISNTRASNFDHAMRLGRRCASLHPPP
jgi:hypothetical protein